MSFEMGPALLFCPGDRPDRFEKAAARADAVILDLEDAVAAADKPAARDAIARSRLDPDRTIVRINAGAGREDDLAAVARSPYRTVMVPKAESADDLAGLEDREIVVLCETARGILGAEGLAADPRVGALMWGAEDLVASLGGTSSRDATGAYRDVATHARSRVLLAAAAHGKVAIDAIRTDIADLDGCLAESVDAAASGFGAKAAIHPSHVPPIREAFLPDAELADWAARILEAASSAGGVFRFEGAMVDEPVLMHARRILARARHGATSPEK